MKELIVRGTSGILYVIIVVVAMYASREWFLALFSLLGLFCIHEFLKLVRFKTFFPFLLFPVLLYYLSYKQSSAIATNLFAIVTLCLNLFLLKDLFIKPKIKMLEKKNYIFLIFYLMAGFIFLTLIPFQNNSFNPNIIVGIFILVWINDSFAYLIGKNFGKKKLLEKVSPKKTMEGFLGGGVATLISSYFIFYFNGIFEIWMWIVLALLVSILGTIGDLIQSKFKREAGVKDSGVIMPGHGGIYDRLDSIIYISPFIYSFLEIVMYVS